MIFVTLGTTKYSFKRPLLEIEKLVKQRSISEPIIVQAGYTELQSDFMEIKDFLSPEEIKSHYHRADIILAHGGTGSIMKGLKLNKKVLVIPRLEKYGEHIDNHQLEVADELEKEGYLLVWQDGEDLLERIHDIEKFNPKPYQSKNEEIINFLISKIDDW